MAIARSVARRKAEINNGTKSGTIAFAFWIRFPLSKSAPLAICAFMILSVSSTRIGINRRAMDIIIEISWTGTPTRFKNPRLFSSPSVSWLGVVVSVKIVEPKTRKISRSAINAANWTPSQVILRKPI